MHGRPKMMSEDRIGRPKRPVQSCGRVYPTRPGAATKGTACLGPEPPIFAQSRPEPLPNGIPRLSLGHDGAFPLPEFLFGAAGRFLRPCRADPCRSSPADQAEPPAG